MKNRLELIKPLPNNLPYTDWVNKVIEERENRNKASEKKQRTTKLKINNAFAKKADKIPEEQLDDLIAFLESKLGES